MLYTVLSVVLLIVVFLIVFRLLGTNSVEITEWEFRENISTFDKVYLNYYRVECVKGNQSYYFITADREALNQFILDSIESGNLTLQYTSADPNATSWTDYIIPALWLGIIIALGVFMFRMIARQNNQNMDFGRSRAKAVHNMKVRFSDVAGADEEKEELQEIIDFLKDPKKFTDMGARVPKGVLLVGPPGTGKTLFAKAVAGEAGVPFFSMSGSDFVEMFVGVGASRVRDLFDQAKKNMPCIIFIDEIDAVGRQRGAGLGGGHDEREQTLNQLLVEMDGFETNTNIIIMAATNRADILDPALLRPGRFDRQIYVNRPDVRGREAILKVHSRKKPIGPDVNFRTVARITAGFTGADLENLLNEASILAVRAGRKVITMADVNEGINKVVMGPQKKSRLVTEPDKRITAYHESGHAILASSLKYCNPVHEVTIIPRGMAAGYTMTRPENDNSHVTKQQLLDDITMTLGGRVAEELIIKNVSSGASGDIKSLTQTAHRMVTEWGMSDRIGPLFYGSEGEIFVGRNYQTEKGYSDEVANTIDEEVRAIVESCHKRATELLTQHTDVLHNMARVLIEKETIHTEEVQLLMQGKSAEDVIAYMEEKEKAADAKASASQPPQSAQTANTSQPAGDAAQK
ncbi:MAG TPA: ATP-dependent zinc metalloprotease FtsH [Candidatus Fimimonas merdipullorum]|uniref:ATP-dependent zinc metalloprotease FtsH n=1 Tax=Candidatus Fimimonas merdipullorum TaxID=2840822 RepID=A0A9D1MYG3_9BACT|nr:ATP-dependent zinc metalloprotease FtsH [Candidatus Fimimonas merdipullorum]